MATPNIYSEQKYLNLTEHKVKCYYCGEIRSYVSKTIRLAKHTRLLCKCGKRFRAKACIVENEN